ncbi:sodium:dicarboxylate symporter [Bacillus sp. FJAT-18017]|uniref:dicarboxylate/amino acid:cation symporter n=1 Tax=Bacillus sp. FJAT-18017 TaxID=1705566 RepID=UPI0006AFBDA1|nr:dicarboxylate/amino acid:cation symporter [Bacillus sp. FJAT-18017]ALC92930.1 sodium:dicarboxylate symporter [Bacillus sp. FJAT-18017]
MKLTSKIIIALVLGAITGLVFNIFAPGAFETLNTFIFTPVGRIFISLISMLVVPIVLFSIILGVAGLGDPKKLGWMGLKTVTYFLATTAIAILIGFAFALVIKPGEMGNFDTENASFEADKAPPVSETLLGIIPTNPFDALTSGNMLQIIVFAIFIGYALTALGEKTKAVRQFIEQGNEIMMFLVGIVMKFAPYGTFGLIASAIGSQGLDAIGAMSVYMIVVLLGLFTHAIITYGSSVYFLGGMNPIKFFKGFAPAMGVAFSTASSNATLPISMETAQKNLKVPEPISSFVQPLGATINMDGTAIMQGVATIFIAQVYGVDLTVPQLATVVLTAVLASIGTAGVPGVGLIMLAMVLQSVNLPVEGIGLILGIDRLLDMVRTAVNITGDAACAVVVSESENRRLEKKSGHSQAIAAEK